LTDIEEAVMTNLVDIEGIAEGYAEKLHAAGVATVEALLLQGATPEGRAKIVEDSGIGHAYILKWVNHADLFRIHGVAGEYAELLEAAGVDTVVELSQRNAENLTEKLAEVNETKHLVRHVPAATEVTKWIAEAKELPRAVSY
jgi:predicted flap endonuclease-1-like 5' DNA nuclease